MYCINICFTMSVFYWALKLIKTRYRHTTVCAKQPRKGRPVNYWQADHSCTNYLRKIDPVYIGADSMMLDWFNKVLYKLWYYSITVIFDDFQSMLLQDLGIKIILTFQKKITRCHSSASVVDWRISSGLCGMEFAPVPFNVLDNSSMWRISSSSWNEIRVYFFLN